MQIIYSIMVVPILIYTHSSYADVMNVCLQQCDKHLSKDIPMYIGIDDASYIPDSICEHSTVITYNNGDSYALRLLHLLNQIPHDTVLIVHEDMMPTAPVLSDILCQVESLMTTHNLVHVRSYMTFGNVIVPRDPICSVQDNVFLFNIPHEANYKMSIQPAIWNRAFYMKLLADVSSHCLSLGSIESEIVQSYVSQHLSRMAYLHNCAVNISECSKEERLYSFYSKRSFVYPHINACGSGKWTITENLGLRELLEQYKIDVSKRGFI